MYYNIECEQFCSPSFYSFRVIHLVWNTAHLLIEQNYRGWAGGCNSKAEESCMQLCKEPSKSQPCKKHPSTLSALPITGIARTTLFYSFRITAYLAL